MSRMAEVERAVLLAIGIIEPTARARLT